ncbi:MAG: hypothetical protein ACREQ7_21160 [Candidatus Binatia bacterium]
MTDEASFSFNPIARRDPIRQSELLDEVFAALVEAINEIRPSTEKQAGNALCRAREIISGACLRAAAVSGSLALQPGPSGWSTILPELAAIWRLQAQMVVDVGAVFGKNGKLSEESILYCLFRHGTAQFMRELVISMGQIAVAPCGPLRNEDAPENTGTEIIQGMARRRDSRWLPMLGAVAVAAYAYYDTDRIGQTAIEFFRKKIEFK